MLKKEFRLKTIGKEKKLNNHKITMNIYQKGLVIGVEYSLPKLAEIFKVEEIAKITTGISKQGDHVFLFHTLDNPLGDLEEDRLPSSLKKVMRKPLSSQSISERNQLSRYLHDYNNFFTLYDKSDIGSYEWEGQPNQTISDPLLKDFIAGTKYQYLLFVRLKKNNSSFIYCGKTQYVHHYLKFPNRPNPVRIISEVKINRAKKMTKLQALYNFKPHHENLKELEFNKEYVKEMESIRSKVSKQIKNSNDEKTMGQFAEEKAQSYYKTRGFSIEDVSDYSSGCDFIATRWDQQKNNEEKRYVEVKSTSDIKNHTKVKISRLQIEKSIDMIKKGHSFDVFILRKVKMSMQNKPHGGEIYLINDYDAKVKYPEAAVEAYFSILRLGKDNSKSFK
jgi:uncharacterized DUF497 family protein